MYYSVYNVKTAKLIYTADSIEKCENKIHELEAQAKLNGLFIPDSFAVYCDGEACEDLES